MTDTLTISAAAYDRMLRDDGIVVLCQERDALVAQCQQKLEELKQIARRETALTSTICALALIKVDA